MEYTVSNTSDNHLKNTILKTINYSISEFAVDGKIPFNKIKEFCNKIDTELNIDSFSGYIDNHVRISATLSKWVEEDNLSLTEEHVNSWEEAESMTIHMSIERPRPRKDKKIHEEIINECLSIINEVIPMDNFVEVIVDDADQMGGTDSYETVGFYTYYKQNHYDNHKEFHGIQD